MWCSIFYFIRVDPNFHFDLFLFLVELLFGVTTTSMTSIDARCERDFPASPTSGKGGREGKEEGGRRRKKIKTNYLASLASSTSSLTRLNNLTTTPGFLHSSIFFFFSFRVPPIKKKWINLCMPNVKRRQKSPRGFQSFSFIIFFFGGAHPALLPQQQQQH